MTPTGFICIPRALLLAFQGRKSADRAADIGAFVWLLAEAAFGEHNGLKRGQVRISTRRLGEELGWSKSRTDRWLQALKKAGQLELVAEGKPGRKAGQYAGQYDSVYRVVEYDTLVGSQPEAGTEGGTVCGTQPGRYAAQAGTPIRKIRREEQEQGNKEENKIVSRAATTREEATTKSAPVTRSRGGRTPEQVERDREIEESFAEAWGIYPKRVGGNSRKAALAQFRARVLAGAEPRELVAGTRRYAAFCEADPERSQGQFVLMGSTFFGPQERYDEQWEIPAAGLARNNGNNGNNGSGKAGGNGYVTKSEQHRMAGEATYRNMQDALEGF